MMDIKCYHQIEIFGKINSWYFFYLWKENESEPMNMNFKLDRLRETVQVNNT